jgi:thioredoxin reductase
MQKIYDVTVVGAGPVGLFGVFYAGMREMSINLMDSLSGPGGQLAALYPEKHIFDMPGFPKVLAKDLVNNMWEQAQFGTPDVHFNRKITKIDPRDTTHDHFSIHTEQGETFLSKTIILAIGMGAFLPRKLEVAGLAERVGKNVHYVLKPFEYYKDKRVLVIGGGDSAADWTLAMASKNQAGTTLAKSTTLIHRGTKFTAHEASITQIKSTNTKVLLNHELDFFTETNDVISATLVNNLTKEKTVADFDQIIICVGYEAKLDFVKDSGLTMQGKSILVNSKMETNIPGIFAIGDVCHHEAKLKLIATGVGEAAIAANYAKVFIDPLAKAFPGHSTSKLGEK